MAPTPEPRPLSANSRDQPALRGLPTGPDRWLVSVTLGALLPLTATALGLLWFGDFSAKLRWTLTAVIVAAGLWFALFLNEKIVYTLRTLANLVQALREGDYVHRLSHAHAGDALGQIVGEINALRDTLQRRHTDTVEARALLEKVVAKIDVAVFVFDGRNRLRLANQKGRQLLGPPERNMLDTDAAELGLGEYLKGPVPRVIRASFGGRFRRWEIRRASFREQGKPHRILFLADLTAPLRREELDAWQRLVRVLRHEISNSLTPIRSFAQTLQWQLSQTPRPPDLEKNLAEGLEVISTRSAALNRMIVAYAGITGLPAPKKQVVDVSDWIRHIAELETRLPVTVLDGGTLRIRADRDQLDQLLINLVKNAVEASLENRGKVTVGWGLVQGEKGLEPDSALEVWVEDEGPGLASTDHLFVPFFSTKEQGSGIGLALSRQIAEAHGGSLCLENRTDGPGCRASFVLPLGDHEPDMTDS